MDTTEHQVEAAASRPAAIGAPRPASPVFRPDRSSKRSVFDQIGRNVVPYGPNPYFCEQHPRVLLFVVENENRDEESVRSLICA